jgi:hypothetical protein
MTRKATDVELIADHGVRDALLVADRLYALNESWDEGDQTPPGEFIAGRCGREWTRLRTAILALGARAVKAEGVLHRYLNKRAGP